METAKPMIPEIEREPRVQYMAFDQYQRYRLVSEVIVELCREASLGWEEVKILDLGGVQGFLRAFIPEGAIITTANVERSTYDRPPTSRDFYVLTGRGLLPFADGAFDFAIACDVLEHIPVADRELFIRELARVSRRAVALIGPFDTKGVTEAENLVNGIYRSIFNTPYVWLQEHGELGLPSLEATVSCFGDVFRTHTVCPTSYLPRWTLLMAANIALARHRNTAALNQQLTDLYARLCYESDHCEPAYRHLVVGIREGPSLDISSVVPRRRGLRRGEPMASYLASVVAIAALRDSSEEIVRREGEIARLSLEVKEKQRLERELEQMRLAREQETAKAAAEIAGLTRERQRLERELEQMRLAREREGARGAAEVGELTRERQRLERELEQMRLAREQDTAKAAAEVGELTRERPRLERELEQMKDARARDQERLLEVQVTAGRLKEKAAQRDAELSRLKQRLAEAEATQAAVQSEVERLLAEIEHYQSGLDKSAQTIARTKAERDEARNRVAELESRRIAGRTRRNHKHTGP